MGKRPSSRLIVAASIPQFRSNRSYTRLRMAGAAEMVDQGVLISFNRLPVTVLLKIEPRIESQLMRRVLSIWLPGSGADDSMPCPSAKFTEKHANYKACIGALRVKAIH